MRLTLLAFITLFCIAGCGTTKTTLDVTPLPSRTPTETFYANSVAEAPPVVSGELTTRFEPTPGPAPSLLLASLRVKSEPNNLWIPFNDWVQGAGLPGPVAASTGSSTAYDLALPNGTLRVQPGARAVAWNGMKIALGYSPVVRDSKPLIHFVDAAKTILPLLEQPAVTLRKESVIVLDAGHGGPDDGARTRDAKFSEKDYALDWALRTRALLVKEGFTVHLTRTNDVEIPLTNRVALTDAVKGDLFLSFHFNSAPSAPEQAGIETYILTPVGAPSTITREFEDDARKVFANNAHDEVNLVIGERIHRSLLKFSEAPDRSLRRARFMTVLREQKRPAVLLEGGYLTNAREAKLIGTAAYRQKLAEAVASAVKSFVALDSAATGSTVASSGGQ